MTPRREAVRCNSFSARYCMTSTAHCPQAVRQCIAGVPVPTEPQVVRQCIALVSVPDIAGIRTPTTPKQ